ncbi:MAG: family 2 glycosyl transferase [Verrucomicrobia bacterium]|nr:family 2 glycosyl transferase [Prolixibacteraceae bacterium]
MFADQYIQNNMVYRPFIADKSSPALSVVVTIPCLNEPEIMRTLESLWECDPIDSHCEVLVCVNDSESSSEEVKAFNRATYNQLLKWQANNRVNLILHPIYAPSVKARFAGAGMARKIVMDEAIRRLDAVGKPDGVIVALDADCLVSRNYLKEIEKVFTQSKSCFAATLNFRHRLEELADPRQQDGIRYYEDYLHYYKQALDYTGFPNCIYTIGSAFAVRAEAYVKQGGMNRRKAGEDFYFLNKLTHLGKLTEITNAWVYPSARVSDRVPFGTGAAMTKWMNYADNLALTYRFEAFQDLKQLFEKTDSFYKISRKQYIEIFNTLPLVIQEYLSKISFEGKLAEVNHNSSSPDTFRKRFFQVFDAFQVLKFLNYAHEKLYARQNLLEAISQLKEAK